MTQPRQRIGLGRPLSAVLHEYDDEWDGDVFSGREVDPATSVLDAALDLLARALPTDLCGFIAGRVSRLGSAADAVAAWALADLLRQVALGQLPASAEDDDAMHLAFPCGPGAAIGLRRVGGILTQREVLLVQSLGTACLLATPGSLPSRRR